MYGDLGERGTTEGSYHQLGRGQSWFRLQSKLLDKTFYHGPTLRNCHDIISQFWRIYGGMSVVIYVENS